MSKPIIIAARQVAREVRAQEDNLDAALAGQARLLGTLLEARRNTGVSAGIGTGALDHAFDAMSHGRELRNAMLAMHRELAQMNLKEMAAGDVLPCPEERGLGELRVVASESSKAA